MKAAPGVNWWIITKDYWIFNRNKNGYRYNSIEGYRAATKVHTFLDFSEIIALLSLNFRYNLTGQQNSVSVAKHLKTKINHKGEKTMIKQNKQIILKISLVLLVISLVTGNINARIIANYGDNVFTNTDDSPKTSGGDGLGVISSASPSIIGIYIAESAGYFLKSHSTMLRLLDRTELAELQGLDYYSLRLDLYRTIEYLEISRLYYTLLEATAKVTPYDPGKIEQLIAFDYQEFQKKNGLNATTFQKVREYLGKGDVTGFFGGLLSRTHAILKKLYELKVTTERDQFPDLQSLWSLNQQYSEFAMMGQYSAQVFYEIKTAAN